VAVEELTLRPGLAAVEGSFHTKTQSHEEKKGMQARTGACANQAVLMSFARMVLPKAVKPFSFLLFLFVSLRLCVINLSYWNTPPEPDAHPPTHGVALAPQSP
jgi:hypothetical protein